MKRKLFLLGLMLTSAFSIKAQTAYSRYDVNHDSKIDMSDVAILINRILGKINYPVTGIELSCTNAYLRVGETLTIASTVTPTDADDLSVTWSSSNSDVASVSSSGKVMGVGVGSATITCIASDGSGVKATCAVTVNTHEYVDLGLSVKWATCNVGARSPEEFGNYFAWGETTGYDEGKTTFKWSTYTLCNGTITTLTKYCTNSSYGTVDDLTTLEAENDAATAIWEGGWRMPTYDELKELSAGCYWEWTSDYNSTGVAGYIIYKVKSDSDKGVRKGTGSSTTTVGSYSLSDTHIFLPAAGFRSYDSLYYTGTHGGYWSSLLGSSATYYAYYMDFNSSDVNWSQYDRYDGRSVRPVHSSSQLKQSPTSSFSLTQYTIKTGETYTQLLSTTSDGTITYSSSDPTVATVDSSTGEVTALAAGTTTITATVSGTSTYTASSASYTITVEESSLNGHDYVDLGLSVKWATCNVGASSPEEYGNYFAWGETTGYNEGKATFDWTAYTLCNGTYSTLTKYCTNSKYGTVDDKTVLESTDDAATANWGGNWRMPTYEEQTELGTGCYWEWTSSYNDTGKAGYIIYKVKSDSDKGVRKYSGSSATTVGSYTTSDIHIFLPAAGFRYSSSLSNAGSYGIYWSCSLSSSYSPNANYLYFNSNDVEWSSNTRYYGQSVRPVCP